MKPYAIMLAVFLAATVFLAGCTTTPSQGGTPVPTTTTPLPPTVTTIPPTTVPTSTASPAASPILGTWYLQELLYQDAPAPLTVQDTTITATFASGGMVSGYGGCNNYEAPYTLTSQSGPAGNGINIGPISKANMFCSATGDLENSYIAILGGATGYLLYPNRILVITDSQGNSLSFSSTPYGTPGASIPNF